MSNPEFWMKHGKVYPYDSDEEGKFDPPVDWAHAAARGVLANLTDRRGVKHGFADIDDDVKVEIVESVAAIIRAAHAAPQENSDG